MKKILQLYYTTVYEKLSRYSLICGVPEHSFSYIGSLFQWHFICFKCYLMFVPRYMTPPLAQTAEMNEFLPPILPTCSRRVSRAFHTCLAETVTQWETFLKRLVLILWKMLQNYLVFHWSIVAEDFIAIKNNCASPIEICYFHLEEKRWREGKKFQQTTNKHFHRSSMATTVSKEKLWHFSRWGSHHCICRGTDPIVLGKEGNTCHTQEK